MVPPPIEPGSVLKDLSTLTVLFILSTVVETSVRHPPNSLPAVDIKEGLGKSSFCALTKFVALSKAEVLGVFTPLADID